MDGPVAISVSADGWDSYSSGTFACSSGVTVDHAVLLVGYTSDYWIIKNQWGTSWGMSGYMNIARGENQDCAIGTSAHVMYQGMISGLSVFFLVSAMASMIFEL